ncbi:MAG TPA: tetratricopeptide repeat protein [Gemmatimonas sp.]|nr:tetratricopeptide repeat protein [Gemmatimonas sp.]
MTWWRRLVGGTSGQSKRPTDFLAEALELEARGDYSNALTSYRLALRERPDDLRVLQNIAIAFSKTNQPEEAIRTYRRALQLDPELAGAHYGLAFLLLKRNDTAHAGMHLESFLRNSNETDGRSARFRAHAQKTLDELRGLPPSEMPADMMDGDAMEQDMPADGLRAPNPTDRPANRSPHHDSEV